MDVPGKRKRGRHRRRWLDNIGEDMKEYEMIADMTENRQYPVLENDGEDCPTKMWRWSLKVRNYCRIKLKKTAATFVRIFKEFAFKTWCFNQRLTDILR